MVVADPHLEGGMTVHQGLEKMLTLYYKLHNESKANAVQTPRKYFYKENTLIPNDSNIFNYRVLYKY